VLLSGDEQLQRVMGIVCMIVHILVLLHFVSGNLFVLASEWHSALHLPKRMFLVFVVNFAVYIYSLLPYW